MPAPALGAMQAPQGTACPLAAACIPDSALCFSVFCPPIVLCTQPYSTRRDSVCESWRFAEQYCAHLYRALPVRAQELEYETDHTHAAPYLPRKECDCECDEGKTCTGRYSQFLLFAALIVPPLFLSEVKPCLKCVLPGAGM